MSTKKLLIVLLLTCPYIINGQTLTQQDVLSKDTNFTGRIKISVVRAVISISNESEATANHLNRIFLAKKIVEDPESMAKTFTIAVVADTTITSGSSDTVINNRIDSIWDAMSKANFNCISINP